MPFSVRSPGDWPPRAFGRYPERVVKSSLLDRDNDDRAAGERAKPGANDDLRTRTMRIDGRRASYTVGGSGLPVVFLHGWALGHNAYRGALTGLTSRGCRVYAPSLPGFGGTADLASDQRTMIGYAAWVEKFVEALDLREPTLVVGHSFGGGVSIRFAHDFPERVRYLVVINSVGGQSWLPGPDGVRRLADRPMWDWGLQFGREMLRPRESVGVWRATNQDLWSNVLTNPRALIEIGLLARSADLTEELAEIQRRSLPVLVLGSSHDGVIPSASFDALCSAVGVRGQVVRGGHSWLLANPKVLTDVLDNVVEVQSGERSASGRRATSEALLEMLATTTVPTELADSLVAEASPLWMLSDPPSLLAGDLVLCHPALAPGEVRAVARPTDLVTVWRLTVVSADRTGLLADTAAVLSAEGLSVQSASATTWKSPDLALHSMTLHASRTMGRGEWEALGRRLRGMQAERPSVRPFYPRGRAGVQIVGGGPGLGVVNVTAPDQIGLLEAISRWLTDHGVSIEAASITTSSSPGGTGAAKDSFVVSGEFDPAELAAHLTRRNAPTGCSLPEVLRSIHRGVTQLSSRIVTMEG